MKLHENLKIIAFVGLIGSGKTTATHFLAEIDYPKVHISPNTKNYEEELVSELQRLVAAGQHRIVVDGIASWRAYKRLLHEFPTAFRVVALFAPRHMRYHYLTRRSPSPVTEAEASRQDWISLEEDNSGGPIAAAQFIIHNDGSLDEFQQRVLAITREAGFSR